MSLIVAPTLDDLGAKPGDLIEFFRPGYQHWAVYIGDGYVVHLTSLSEGLGSGSNSMASVGSDNAVVKKAKYSDVVGSSKCRVNNTLDDDYKPRPADVVVREARASVGRQMPYRLLELNCEHFATNLRYGVAESRQARRASEVALAATGGVALGLGVAVVGAILKGSSKEKKNTQ